MAARSLFFASTRTSFGGVYGALLVYTLCYMPTLALSNSLSFRQMRNPGVEFPPIRVLGTIGWIVAGLLIGTLGLEATASPLRLAACASVLLGVFCLALPHTPPMTNQGPAGTRSPATAGHYVRAILGLDARSCSANDRSPCSCSAHS